jgi:hypothetical protein
MSYPTLIPDPRDAEKIQRFVELSRDISLESLSQADLDELPKRDCTYVWRLLVLAEEDPEILSRQRITWTKLRNDIPLLESEARELVEVLGCRGFYDVSLDLSGMCFANLVLRGAVIGGNYRCRFTSVRGECDETALLVGGTATVGARHIEGVARGPWATSDKPPERMASNTARFEEGQQLSLPQLAEPEASPTELHELSLGALAAPRVPTRVSNEILASLPPMVELADDDIVEDPESLKAPRNSNSPRPRRAPARQPRTGTRPGTRASRPPDLRVSPVTLSDPRLLPRVNPGEWQGRLLDSASVAQGALPHPIAQQSIVADTGEIDADW